MNRENTTQTEFIGSSRMTVTNDWVNAQTRSNMQAGLGVSCMVGVVVVGVVIVLGWDNETLVVAVILSILIGVFYFGWLSFSRFSADEWLDSAARKAMVERLEYLEELEEYWKEVESTNKTLLNTNADLKDQLHLLRTRQKVRSTIQQTSLEPTQSVQKVSGNVWAARQIVERWFLDPNPDHPMVGRDRMIADGMERHQIEAGWSLLWSLKVAEKEGAHRNAAWVITCDDQNEIVDRIQDHIRNTSTPSV